MLPLLTLSSASENDSALIRECALDEHSLVSNAATGAYLSCRDLFRGKRVLFVVGKGNNGSDALALASLVTALARSVSVYCHFPDGSAENMRRRLQLEPSLFVDEMRPADVIVDGLFGVKCRLPLDERTEDIISFINSSGAVVIALDVPSAFRVRADYTISFMCPKKEMYLPQNRASCGKIILFNPGFPEGRIRGDGKTFLLTGSDYFSPPIPLDGYKNTRGHVCIAGGSERYPGAPIISSLAAFHSGAGKVTILSTGTVRERILASHPSLMFADEGTPLTQYDSFVAGPGWDEGSREILERISQSGKNYVVDADAIKLLPGLKTGGRAVITPHAGEFGKLLALLGFDEGDIIRNAERTALELECVVVLKGVTTIITDGSLLYIADGANPSLGVAGSGDVLSGVIGAFLAYGLSPLTAAVNGVLLHQRSGRAAEEEYGFYSAEDLIKEIGRNR